MMKKVVIFTVVIMIMIAGTVQAQRSKMYNGDKSAREIRKSQTIFWDQIRELEYKVHLLNQDNLMLVKRINYVRDSNLYYEYVYRVHDNDSLISLYQSEINYLRQSADGFTVTAAGKDKQSYLDLRSRDPKELANAYLIAAYADNMSQYKNAETTLANTDGNLKGMVQNLWYRDVIAKVTGPGNFYREFYLKRGERSPIFILPFIGDYKTVFVNGNECKAIEKPVGPNIVYYDKISGTLDYIATLPAY